MFRLFSFHDQPVKCMMCESQSSFVYEQCDWRLKQNSGLSHMVCKERGDGAVYCGNKAENGN